MDKWLLLDRGFATWTQSKVPVHLKAIQVVHCSNCNMQVAANEEYEETLAALYRLCDPGDPFSACKLEGLDGEWVIYGTP